MSKYKYQRNHDLVCPHCDHENEGIYDYYEGMSDEDTGNFVCEACHVESEYTVHFQVLFSTKSVEGQNWEAYWKDVEEVLSE
jgi:hypothetical protein